MSDEKADEKVFGNNRRRNQSASKPNNKNQVKQSEQPVTETETTPEAQPQPQPDQNKKTPAIEVPELNNEKEPEFEIPAEKQNPYSLFTDEAKMRDGDAVPEIEIDVANEPKIPEPDISDPRPREQRDQTLDVADAEISEDVPPPASSKPLIENPGASTMSPAEKQEAAEAAAEGIIKLFNLANVKGFGWYAGPSNKKIKKMVMEGEIDAELQIPTMDGTMTFAECIQNINGAIPAMFSIDKEDSDALKPHLSKVCLDNGITPTPLQMCFYYGAIIIEKNLEKAIALRENTSELVKYTKELSKQMKINTDDIIRDRDTQKVENDLLRRTIEDLKKQNAQPKEKTAENAKPADTIQNAEVIDEGDFNKE